MKGRIDLRQGSQLGQDCLVQAYLGNMVHGTFLDIGCGDPIVLSNTYGLEVHWGWSGIGLDIELDQLAWSKLRPDTKAIRQDVTQLDSSGWLQLLEDSGLGDRIDFLSIDLEPPDLSLQVLFSLPFHRVQFGCICFETDSYRDPGGSARALVAKNRLESMGYVLRAELFPSLPDTILNARGHQDQFYVHNSLLRRFMGCD